MFSHQHVCNLEKEGGWGGTGGNWEEQESEMQESGLDRRKTQHAQLSHETDTLWGVYLAEGVCKAALASAPWHGSLGWPDPSYPLGSVVLGSAVLHHQEACCTAGREAAGASWGLWHTIAGFTLKLWRRTLKKWVNDVQQDQVETDKRPVLPWLGCMFMFGRGP